MIVKYETFSKVISVVMTEETEERSYNDPIKGFYAQSIYGFSYSVYYATVIFNKS